MQSSPIDVGPTERASDDEPIALGNAFVRAVLRHDFDAIEAILTPDVTFRALTPRTVREATTASGARDWFERWFGETDRNELIESRVDVVGDRLHVAYRIRLREDRARHIVEQQLYSSVTNGHLADVTLLCSGFRPVPGPPHADARMDAIGKSCATLTPAIRAAVRQLEPGQVLEIVTDDPTAEDGLRAWTRLTGNELIDVTKGADAAGSFYVRRGAAPTQQTTPKGAES